MFIDLVVPHAALFRNHPFTSLCDAKQVVYIQEEDTELCTDIEVNVECGSLGKNPLGGCNIIIRSTYPNEIVEDVLEFSFLADAYTMGVNWLMMPFVVCRDCALPE